MEAAAAEKNKLVDLINRVELNLEQGTVKQARLNNLAKTEAVIKEN